MAIKLRRLQQLVEERTKEVRMALERGGIAVHRDAVLAVQKGPASGTIRPDGSQRSAPGEAPMSDTGFLAKNIVLDIEGRDVLVISRSAYSKPLEYGTRHMEPRPFMHPAFEKNKEQIMKNIRRALGGS